MHIDVSVSQEACPLGLAPTSSTTATLAMGDECASIMLEKLHRNRKHRPQNAKRTVFDSELLIRGSEIYPVNRKKAKE